MLAKVKNVSRQTKVISKLKVRLQMYAAFVYISLLNINIVVGFRIRFRKFRKFYLDVKFVNGVSF